MKSFLTFITESATEGAKLKHITHAEDRPLFHGAEGYKHAAGALNQAHEHLASGKQNTSLSTKFDGSPSTVFGHHPKTGKFFVASKSAFNKEPKINYTNKDIEANHGHAPGLVHKLKLALKHLPKVAPKSGVYQADLMHSKEDVHHDPEKKTSSFKPNTIKYTAHGDKADAVHKSKLGIAVHTKYENGSDGELHNMSATPHTDMHNFGSHPDVVVHSTEHDSGKVKYPEKDKETFKKHMDAAHEIHTTAGKAMYKAVHPAHSGESGHLASYINSTVRTDEKPTHEGFQKHITAQYAKAASKVKTEASKTAKTSEGKAQVDHVKANADHYSNLLKMHGHLATAKHVLVKNLNKETGGLSHHIGGTPTQPEGFVVHHKGEPTKLVNRAEFSKANLLKTR